MYKDVVELVESNPRDRIESLAQAVLDALPAHVALLDARGTIVTVNRAWREWGAQRGAVPERTAEGVSYLAVCRTSASAEAMAVAIEAVLRGETPIAVAEYECHHGNDRRWFVCEVARVEGWEGALVAHTDVTESVLAFREAEKVRQRYRALFERNLAGVVRCTAGGVILECNAAFAALLGVASPEALPGRLVTELFDSREWDQFAAAAGEETSVSFETAVRRPDGRMVWLIVTAVASDDAAQPFLEAMAVDITDTKRREDAYQREAEVESAISAIYSDLLQAAPEEIDVAIERGLHRAGMLSGGERAHLLAIEKRRATSLFEWRRPGIAVRFRAGEPFRLPESRWLVEQLAAGRGVMASRIPDLPDAHTRALLEEEGVGALIVVPMMGMDGLAGALAIESSHEYAWPDEMVLILHLLAETFARVIERRRAEESLRTANRMLETRVNERTAELRALATKLLRIQEEERATVARDIHDELGQSLTELNLGVAALKDVADRDELHRSIDEVRRMVARTIQSLQRVAADLRPSLLDRLGLVPAIELQVTNFRTRTGIDATFRCDRDVAASPDAVTAIFRIVQEALTNVSRHAEATRVRVHLRDRGGALILTVRDNGRGIGATHTHGIGSLGMVGMRERAHMIGGELRVRGRRGRGTVVRLRLAAAGGESRR